MDDSTRIERETSVPMPAEEVWPAVSSAEELSAWFGADVELDARPWGRAVFRWPDGSERGATVEEVEPPHKLVFRWLPFARSADGSVVDLPQTRVEIVLEPDGEDTIVRVVESPLALVR